jgi:protein SCO1/2
MRPSAMTSAHLSAITIAAILLSAGACTPSATRPAPTAATVTTSATDRYSVYDLDRDWRNQRGETVRLASLRGRPQVIAMIYTHCTTTCPFTVAEMKRIERESPVNAGFVLVSLDPARDDPARLAMFASERGLDAKRWTLLDGNDDAVRELANVLGVQYRRLSPEELAHSNALTLVDTDGVVADQHAGLDASPEMMTALAALQR